MMIEQHLRFLSEHVVRFGKLAATGVSIAIALVLLVTDMGRSLDDTFAHIRDGWRERPASGEVVIVEIDAHSIRQFDTWPWPRRYHAQLVDALRKAGVHSLAFDVDFSSASNPRDDAALAAALDRFGGSVVLPTFRQATGSGRAGETESLPIPILREHAFLGAVNVRPDADGSVTQQLYGVMTAGVPRPSLAASVADAGGDIGKTFPIDLAIDPASIPRFSFADIVSGAFDPADLADKRVIVGASAIELPDRYAVPRHGVIYGVVIQALAAETLMAGTPPLAVGGWPLLLIAALIVWFALRRSYAVSMTMLGAGIAICTILLPFALEYASVATVQILPAFACLVTAAGLQATMRYLSTLSVARYQDNESGMPNARALVRDLAGKRPAALIVMNIPHFEDLTSVFADGETGKFVQAVAARLQVGNGGAPIYRTDANLLVWPGTSGDSTTIAAGVEGLAALFQSRMAVAGREVVVKPGFGIAMAGDDIAIEKLLTNAVHAARHADERELGYCIYGNDLAESSAEMVSLLTDIDRALNEGEMRLVYQPKQALESGAFAGAEALIRWDHPEHGAIPPDRFVPLIEREGWEARLATLVLDIVLADITAWAEQGFAPKLAINLSANLFEDGAFVERFLLRLEAANLPSGQLGIEVTESAVLSDRDMAFDLLNRFRAIGCPVSIDDYGTGQSTLTYLRRLPADEIKIDQSFIRNLTEQRTDQILVRSTIEMAHEMGFKVIAEGIEDAATYAQLAAMDCDIGQGWHISRPLEKGALHAWVGDSVSAKAA